MEFAGEVNDTPLDEAAKLCPPEKQAAERAIGENADLVSVAYIPLAPSERNRAFEIGGDVRRASASLIKLLILAELLDEVAQGTRQLDEQVVVSQDDLVGGSGIIQTKGSGTTFSLDDLARYMITESDNVAANKLIDLLGMDAINSQATKLGLQQTILQRKMLDEEAVRQGRENYTCSNDIAHVLDAIAAGTFIDATMSDLALNYLEQQTDTEGILGGLPPNIALAHKTGTLDRAKHDGGIAFADEPYILVVMTENMEETQALTTIGAVSEAIYEERQSL